MTFNSLELFAGAGGLALGLEQAGFEPVGLVELDPTACQTLRINRPHWNTIEKDITQLSGENIADLLSLPSGQLDLLSGGYPCQAFSYAGQKKGLEDVRGTLFYHYAVFLEKLMPKMFLAENVRGLVSHDKGRTLTTMIDIFSSIGYSVEWKVLNAWDYGVAQKRQRIIIIGIRQDLAPSLRFSYPSPHGYRPILRDILKDVPPSEGVRYSVKKTAVMDLVPPGGYWRDLPVEIAKEYMKGSYYLGGGKTGIARRMSWDEPSLTLTCSPSQQQTDRCHPDESRPFTTRECARIQSFPDSWQFAGNPSNIYKQIGNAVPVQFAKCVGAEIYKTLSTGYKNGQSSLHQQREPQTASY